MASDKKIAALDAADLDNEFFKYVQIKVPEEFEKMTRLYNEFMEKLKKKIEVPDLKAPTRIVDGGSDEARKTATKLKRVNEEYEQLQEKEHELRRERSLIRRTKEPRVVPEIKSDEKKINIESSLKRNKSPHHSEN